MNGLKKMYPKPNCKNCIDVRCLECNHQVCKDVDSGEWHWAYYEPKEQTEVELNGKQTKRNLDPRNDRDSRINKNTNRTRKVELNGQEPKEIKRRS